MKIWLDDERPKPNMSWTHLMNSDEAIQALRIYKHYSGIWSSLKIEAISLDHDLGGDDNSRRVVTWMIENNYWPKRIHVHTANPVGREWLVGTINRYGPLDVTDRVG